MAAITRPPGVVFGRCQACPFKNLDVVTHCYDCFREVVPAIPKDSCPICGQVKPDVRCRNALCNSWERNFMWNRSLGYLDKDGPFYDVVVRKYKYQDRLNQWGNVLGRILAGYLDEQAHIFKQFDLIIPNPIYLGSDGKRQWDPVAFVLGVTSALAGDRWPICGRGTVMKKLIDTRPMMEAHTRQERQAVAKELRVALCIMEPALVRKKMVLVFDDIFTEGSTLNEVAGCLKRAGAEKVASVTLGRIPWREPPTPVNPAAHHDFDDDIPF